MGFECRREGKSGRRAGGESREERVEERENGGKSEPEMAIQPRVDTRRAGWAGSTAGSVIG